MISQQVTALRIVPRGACSWRPAGSTRDCSAGCDRVRRCLPRGCVSGAPVRRGNRGCDRAGSRWLCWRRGNCSRPRAGRVFAWSVQAMGQRHGSFPKLHGSDLRGCLFSRRVVRSRRRPSDVVRTSCLSSLVPVAFALRNKAVDFPLLDDVPPCIAVGGRGGGGGERGLERLQRLSRPGTRSACHHRCQRCPSDRYPGTESYRSRILAQGVMG